MAMYPGDMQRLAEMLRPPEDQNTSDERLPSASRSLAGPQSPPEHSSSEAREEPKDDRLQPEVRLAYSQEVRPEDLYLGLGLRTPGSASCESLRVTLRLPEEEAGLAEMDAHVDCARNVLEFRSPRYRLTLPLPQPADPRASLHRAQWDAGRRQLTVTVRMRRELDYTNF